MAAPSNVKRPRKHGPVDITVACSPSQATLITLKINIQSTVPDLKKHIYQSSGELIDSHDVRFAPQGLSQYSAISKKNN